MSMDSKTDRIAKLSEALAHVADARTMATTDVWGQAWDMFERELIERMLKCGDGPEEDATRYRLQIAVNAARSVRRVIEHASRSEDGLRKELDVLEGRRLPRVA